MDQTYGVIRRNNNGEFVVAASISPDGRAGEGGGSTHEEIINRTISFS
jgi:hypothetical protein